MSTTGPGSEAGMFAAQKDELNSANAEPDVEGAINETVTTEIIEIEEQPGFRWWYVPAVGIPVIAGAGTAIWFLSQPRRPLERAYANATKQATALLAGTAVGNALGIRKSPVSRILPLRRKDIRSQAVDSLADAREQAMDTLNEARKQALELWDSLADLEILAQARDRSQDLTASARKQAGKLGMSLAGTGAALLIRNQLDQMRGRAQKQQPSKATAPRKVGERVTAQASARTRLARLAAKGAVESTQAKANRAVSKTTRKANRAVKRTRAFTFGLLVSAMVAYVRTYYARQARQRDLAEMSHVAPGA